MSLNETTPADWDALKPCMVNSPKHYQLFPDMEVIDLIKSVLTPAEYAGYLKGNILKYKLRAGDKDDVQQDLAKAKKYKKFLEEFING